MRPSQINSLKYKDGLAEKRRKVFIFKTSFFIVLAVALVGLISYFLFFSGILEIKDISVNGLDKVSEEEFDERLKNRFDSKWLGHIEHQRNILFFDPDAFRAEILASFPEVKDVSVSKEPPHALNIIVTERATTGIWCFNPSADNRDPAKAGAPFEKCKYFDEEGSAWGEAAKSSGFLILSVDDLRPNIQNVDKDLLKNLIFVSEHLKEIDIFIDKFIIPEDFFGDFKALTSQGYVISCLDVKRTNTFH